MQIPLNSPLSIKRTLYLNSGGRRTFPEPEGARFQLPSSSKTLSLALCPPALSLVSRQDGVFLVINLRDI